MKMRHRLPLEVEIMPEISRFFGIVIRMYYNDHQPPHFHAAYSSDEAVVRFDPVGLLHGGLSPRSLSMVVEWAVLHETELIENWRRARAGQALEWIEGLS
ncbi:MAG TPA: DUF4160 domain-containing protein [Humisphaera sp.]|jgi:hypothetical protein|nr:DUF4160 domain-containing protein [Humisphaera sp.]